MEGIEIKPIECALDHQAALGRIDNMMQNESLPDEDVNLLKVLAILVEKYENEHFSIGMPSPIEAIEFRIDQLGINRAELSEIVGFPKSRISDVLNGKRSLSLDMIRALKAKLEIPADVLLGNARAEIPPECLDVDWKSFPIAEMARYGWLHASVAKEKIEETIRALMVAAGVDQPRFAGAAFRGTEAKKPDAYAVNAWLMVARAEAIKSEAETDFRPENVDAQFRRELAKLSLYSDGPIRAFSALREAGVTPVCVRPLKHTYIDGACFSLPSGKPAIAISRRHDRIDNFWFTLLHECVHVEKHLEGLSHILDDTEGQNGAFGNDPSQENEANELARTALIPSDIFDELSRGATNISASKIEVFSRRADVHRAIIAGQVRNITGHFTHFSNLLGRGEISKTLHCK
jgi:HTH-type transcriptional regulator / antitoxin HigA